MPQEPAHQQGPLEIAAREKLSHVRPMDEDERWALSRRLMHDDDLAVEDRFAGLLVLLYAQSLTTVCQLPVTAVIVADSQTSLMLGDSPCCCLIHWTSSPGGFSLGDAGTSLLALRPTRLGSSLAPSRASPSATNTWAPGSSGWASTHVRAGPPR